MDHPQPRRSHLLRLECATPRGVRSFDCCTRFDCLFSNRMPQQQADCSKSACRLSCFTPPPQNYRCRCQLVEKESAIFTRIFVFRFAILDIAAHRSIPKARVSCTDLAIVPMNTVFRGTQLSVNRLAI